MPQRYQLHLGDCLDVLETFESNSIDHVVTDQPYGLSNKEPDTVEVLTHWLNGDDYHHRGSGFMGKSWDSFVPGPATWKEVYRVLKPGGFALVFGGTRTYDLATLALRLAGFQIRDCIMWLQAQGFPKSHNISKAIDKAAGAERKALGQSSNVRPNSNRGNGLAHGDYGKEWDITAPATDNAQTWDGYGTAMKPSYEPIIVAMKPIEGTFANNALTWGVAGLNIDGCRVPTNGESLARPYNEANNIAYGKYQRFGNPTEPNGRWPANLILSRPEYEYKLRNNINSIQLRSLSEYMEDKGIDSLVIEQDVYDSMPVNLRFLFYRLPIDEEQDVTQMLDKQSGNTSYGNKKGGYTYSDSEYKVDGFTHNIRPKSPSNYADNGGASRFFYCAKTSKKERNRGMPPGHKNTHPTVKPEELMKYLCRLVKTPYGGTILDPFMGSGTTGIAALSEEQDFIGIEQDSKSLETATWRIEHSVWNE